MGSVKPSLVGRHASMWWGVSRKAEFIRLSVSWIQRSPKELVNKDKWKNNVNAILNAGHILTSVVSGSELYAWSCF